MAEPADIVKCKKCGSEEFRIDQGQDSGELYVVCRNCLEKAGYLRKDGDFG